MHKFIFAIALMAPLTAIAQADPPKTNPEMQALSDTVISLTSQNIALRAQLIALQAENKSLKDQAPKPDVDHSKP